MEWLIALGILVLTLLSVTLIPVGIRLIYGQDGVRLSFLFQKDRYFQIL